jgi:sec-independent protein translocase protein TatA
MGLSGISVWEIILILLVVPLLFGTKRVRTIGSDLGTAVRDFRRAMTREPEPTKSWEAGLAKGDREPSEDKSPRARVRRGRHPRPRGASVLLGSARSRL